MLKRKQYLEVTKLDRDGLTARKRRDQIPFPSEGRNEYTPFDALTVLMVDHLANPQDGLGMNISLATKIVRDCGRRILEALDDIVSGSLASSKSPVYVGRIKRQEANEAFCGTAEDLAAAMSRGGRIIDIAILNASLEYGVLHGRCSRLGIDLADCWPDPHSVPSEEQFRQKRIQPLKEAMERRSKSGS